MAREEWSHTQVEGQPAGIKDYEPHRHFKPKNYTMILNMCFVLLAIGLYIREGGSSTFGNTLTLALRCEYVLMRFIRCSL